MAYWDTVLLLILLLSRNKFTEYVREKSLTAVHTRTGKKLSSQVATVKRVYWGLLYLLLGCEPVFQPTGEEEPRSDAGEARKSEATAQNQQTGDANKRKGLIL